MSRMTELGGTDTCARCGSIDDVRVVKYVRSQQKFTELWCRRCRQQKLVRPRREAQAVRRPMGGAVKTAMLLVAVAALVAVIQWVLRLQ